MRKAFFPYPPPLSQASPLPSPEAETKEAKHIRKRPKALLSYFTFPEAPSKEQRARNKEKERKKEESSFISGFYASDDDLFPHGF